MIEPLVTSGIVVYIMGLGEQYRLSHEGIQVLEMTGNHDVRLYDPLATAKYHLLPAYEREMGLEPGLFLREATWKFGCGRNDKDLVYRIEPLNTR